MKRFILICLLCLPTISWACDYGDDPRLDKDWEALVKAIQSGQESGQIRMTLATYLGMGASTRKLFGDNVLISSLDCKPIGVLDGEIVGIALMPFEDFYRAMARAIRKNKPTVAKKLMVHGRVSAMPVEQYVDMFGDLPFERIGGVKVRNQMMQIFPASGHLPPQPEWLKDKAKQGRMDDYTMARLFNIFGGKLTLNKGCGPYEMSKKFYIEVQVTGPLGGIHDRSFGLGDPVKFMLKIAGLDMEFVWTRGWGVPKRIKRIRYYDYKIKGCTP